MGVCQLIESCTKDLCGITYCIASLAMPRPEPRSLTIMPISNELVVLFGRVLATARPMLRAFEDGRRRTLRALAAIQGQPTIVISTGGLSLWPVELVLTPARCQICATLSIFSLTRGEK